MVKNGILAIFISLFCSGLALNTHYSPVLFFKHKENGKSFQQSVISSTTKIDQRDFERRFDNIGQDQQIVFFVLPDLSPEHLSTKNDDGIKAFQYIASQTKIIEYIPYVQNAADNKITEGDGVEHASVNPINELEPAPSSNARVIIVTLPARDASESDFHWLARIDRACFAVSQSDKFKDALFILTSESNSYLQDHSRKARDVIADTKADPKAATKANDVLPFKSANFLVYFKKAYKKPKKDTAPADIDVKGITSEITETKEKKNIKLMFDSSPKIELLFSLDKLQYWSLDSATLDGVSVDQQFDIHVPKNFSFSCTSSFFIKLNETNYSGIKFNNLQIQLDFDAKQGGADIKKFAESYDCVGFTSAGIWSALFITFLLLGIVALGITFIMDIRTMDRFDDPKGKTITVTASE